MATDTLTQARTLVERLSFQEKVYLLSDLTRQMLQHVSADASVPPSQPLPTLHLAAWPQGLPLRREELYDDRGR